MRKQCRFILLVKILTSRSFLNYKRVCSRLLNCHKTMLVPTMYLTYKPVACTHTTPTGSNSTFISTNIKDTTLYERDNKNATRTVLVLSIKLIVFSVDKFFQFYSQVFYYYSIYILINSLCKCPVEIK